MKQTNDVGELNERIQRLVDDNYDLREKIRRVSAENSLGYQLNLVANRFLQDAWNWKWVIILIAVEVYRLWVDQQNTLASMDTLQKIQGLIIDFMDLVKPGPRG